MAIKVKKEPNSLSGAPIEKCVGCGYHTRFWANSGSFPCCPECAKIYNKIENQVKA